MPSPLPDNEQLKEILVNLLSRELRISTSDVRSDLPFTQYGLDSMAALAIAGDLEDQFDLKLPSTLLWDCPTVDALADYLSKTHSPALLASCSS